MAGNILVATDGSDTGNRAVDTAAQLAGCYGADLCIVHVLLHGRPAEEWAHMAEVEHLLDHLQTAADTGSSSRPATLQGYFADPSSEVKKARAVAMLGDEVLARAKRRAEDAGVKNVTTQVCSGDYADEILDVAEAEEPKMIVIGSRGLGRVRGALLGSVSQKVLNHAGSTVVVVR